MSEERLAKYLHLPVRILWFDTDEITLMVVFYILALTFGGLLWIALIVLPPFLINKKREMARGHIQHMLYEYGWLEFKGYPNPSAKVFHE